MRKNVLMVMAVLSLVLSLGPGMLAFGAQRAAEVTPNAPPVAAYVKPMNIDMNDCIEISCGDPVDAGVTDSGSVDIGYAAWDANYLAPTTRAGYVMNVGEESAVRARVGAYPLSFGSGPGMIVNKNTQGMPQVMMTSPDGGDTRIYCVAKSTDAGQPKLQLCKVP